MNTNAFDYKGWTLCDAIDALMAYDHGATDSGVNDEAMRAAVKAYFAGLGPDECRTTCAVLARDRLEDARLAAGYGLADVVALARWLEEQGVDT